MPNNKEKIMTLLGFAQKAGKLCSGVETVLNKSKKKEASLLILAEDAPADVADRMKRTALGEDIPYIVLGRKNELGIAIGRSGRNVVLIMDEGFASAILKNITY